MVKAGQLLRDARVRRKLTIEDVAKATKIRDGFLLAIEKGEYNRLPSAAYATGFVRNYATFIGLAEKEVLAIFRREFDEEKVFKVLPDSWTTSRDFPRRSIRIQQTLLLLVGVFVLFAAYIGYQYRFMVVNPPLQVSSPKEQSVTTPDVTIEGSTDSDAVVIVNNVPVAINTNGTFTKRLTLFPGKTTITIIAKNRIGKTTEIKRNITVEK